MVEEIGGTIGGITTVDHDVVQVLATVSDEEVTLLL